MRIFAIRHGITEWNSMGKIQGRTDIPLNEAGVKSAYALAAEMRAQGYIPTEIFTSPLARAYKTAEIVASEFSLTPEAVTDFQEMSFGLWEGLSWNEITEKYPAEFKAWNNDRTVQIPEGESYIDLTRRIIPEIRRACEKSEGDFAIVAHGAVIMAMHVIYEGIEFESIDKIMRHIKNSSVTVFDAERMLENAEKFEKSGRLDIRKGNKL